MLTTIQISKEEDKLITKLKKMFALPSKKAVIMAGVHQLLREHESRLKNERLQKAVLAVRDESQAIVEEMSSLASTLERWDEN